MTDARESAKGASEVIDRLVRATNEHDLAGLVACFADDYVNETPAHPLRGFGGRDQVHSNWTQIFAGVPDIATNVIRRCVDGDTVWTEWDMSGTRRDGAAFGMRGVVIFGIVGDTISTARFYLEPVEESSGDVDDHTRRVVGDSAAPAAGARS